MSLTRCIWGRCPAFGGTVGVGLYLLLAFWLGYVRMMRA